MGYTIEIPTSDFGNLLDRIFLATPLYLITLDLSQQTYKHPIVILILQYSYQESSLIKRNVISTDICRQLPCLCTHGCTDDVILRSLLRRQSRDTNRNIKTDT